ncbi:hypothetical protein NPIL_572751 [Nephila pilipes]|uniref:Uncharacterized protein n=1 Tax=Nephila pilipes TaxID=299642 RepID=A0A8X6UJP7_NEPPI|nr:hypothetical protein NPIL_572751 [Nephila pilipes]
MKRCIDQTFKKKHHIFRNTSFVPFFADGRCPVGFGLHQTKIFQIDLFTPSLAKASSGFHPSFLDVIKSAEKKWYTLPTGKLAGVVADYHITIHFEVRKSLSFSRFVYEFCFMNGCRIFCLIISLLLNGFTSSNQVPRSKT